MELQSPEESTTLQNDENVENNDIFNDDDEENIDEWLENLKNLEKNYDIFYSEPVNNVNIVFFYVNNGELEKIRQENVDITNGVLNKDQLIYIINDNKHMGKIKYFLTSILKYNVTIEPNKIHSFLTDESEELSSDYVYLQKLKSVNNVRFSDTITMFNDFNSLYIIFNKNKPSKNQTKKVNLGKGRNTKKKALKGD